MELRLLGALELAMARCSSWCLRQSRVAPGRRLCCTPSARASQAPATTRTILQLGCSTLRAACTVVQVGALIVLARCSCSYLPRSRVVPGLRQYCTTSAQMAVATTGRVLLD